MLASPRSHRPASLEELLPSDLCARLDRIDLLSRKVFAGKIQGERRSKRRGQSVEFEDHRNYVPGDDLRHIDWNVFARLDKFFIKVFQQEEDLSFHLVIDSSASMDAGTPNKLTLVQRLAMSLGYIALVNNDRVAVSVLDGRELRRLPPMRGRRHVQRLAQFILHEVHPPALGGPALGGPPLRGGSELGSPAPGSPPLHPGRGVPAPSFASALRTIASERSGKGVMVLLSDFLIPEGYQDGLRYLASAGSHGYDTYCLQVLSPGEIDPAADGAGRAPAAGADDDPGPLLIGDLKLTDAETNNTAEVTITTALLKRYRAAAAAYIAELAAFCTARGMTHALVRSDADLGTLLLDYLRRRGLLR